MHSVLNVLHSLVDKSNINKQFEVYNSQGNPDAVAGDFGRPSLYKMLGYFSLVGLLRLHSLLGDAMIEYKDRNMEIREEVKDDDLECEVARTVDNSSAEVRDEEIE